MVDGRTEQDIERLRAAYLLVDRHASILAKENIDLKQRIAELEGRELTQAELELPLPEVIEVTLDSSDGEHTSDDEKKDSPAGDGADGSSAPEEKQRRPGHGPRSQPKLPLVFERHELPADERECKVCGGTLEEMGSQSEDSEEITVVERAYTIVVHQRQKYRCDCNANVVTASAPERLVPGGRYSNDLIATVAIDKYADNIPLESQVQRMARSGLEVTSSTLVDLLHALTALLEPVWRELYVWMLDNEPVLNVDETGWPFADRKTGRRRRTAWCVSSPRAVIHHLLASKSGEMAERLLGGYEGVVVADGYQVYESLAKAEDEAGFSLANCWAHVLRKFRACLETEPERSREVLHLIGLLYRVEENIPDSFPGDEEAQAQRLDLRRTWSAAVAAKIREWAFSQGGLRRSPFGKAVAYMMNRWDNLTRFLSDPKIPLDNNHAERSLRKLVIGRKIHYGSRSEAGLRIAEVHYSLIDSCRLNDVDPLAYYRHLIATRLVIPETIVLPHEFAASLSISADNQPAD